MGKLRYAHKITHNFGRTMKVVLLMAFVLFAGRLASQSLPVQPDNGEMRVRYTPDFEVTGDGSASAWDAAEWIALTQRRATGGTYATSLKVLYSGTGIYCLFRCEDRVITATLKEHFTDLYKEDVVEVFFWPDESVPVYFEYELSPLNYELAIMVPNYDGNFFGWLPWHYEGERVTRHATKVTDKDGDATWTAEMFIPFALLKPLIPAPPQEGTRWRANFYRIDYDGGISQWSWRLTQKNFHDYKSFGTIVFEKD